jgi:hypothetical protein
MKKKTLSLFALLFAFLSISFFTPKSVLADGMMIQSDPYSDRFDYSGESNQQAFINYDNGLEKMILSVGLQGGNSSSTVWLFPVPADPNKVVIDVANNLPALNGDEISGKAMSNLDNATKILQMTQLYTIPFVNYENIGLAGNSMNSPSGIVQSLDNNAQPDVVTYEQIDKEGISSEIVTAKTADGLYNYLKGKGLNVESNSIPVLNNYIGKDYSFVVSWISPRSNIMSAQDIINELAQLVVKGSKFYQLLGSLSQKYPELAIGPGTELDADAGAAGRFLMYPEGEQALQEITNAVQKDPSIIDPSIIADAHYRIGGLLAKGIFVTFPTDKIYFPLLPTSVYGSQTVPATIRVIGYVSPEIFQDIKSYTNTKYYIESYANFGDDLKNFYSGQNQNVKYTKIEINAPSKYFTDDLWINNQASIKTYYLTFIVEHPVASAIILFVLSSIIAGILAGLILFKDLRRKPIKLGLIGLSNLLTIIGLLITTILVGTKNKNGGVDPLLAEIKQKGYFWKRRVATILFIVAILLLLSGLCLFWISGTFHDFIINPEFYVNYLRIPLLILYVLPIVALIVSFIIKRIKPEDRNLFEQLKSSGYSSWSFQLKDKLKIVFVPIFSVSFLFILWLLVKLAGSV